MPKYTIDDAKIVLTQKEIRTLFDRIALDDPFVEYRQGLATYLAFDTAQSMRILKEGMTAAQWGGQKTIMNCAKTWFIIVTGGGKRWKMGAASPAIAERSSSAFAWPWQECLSGSRFLPAMADGIKKMPTMRLAHCSAGNLSLAIETNLVPTGQVYKG